MDPYALGLLLGDGCLTGSTTPGFTTADPELAEAMQEAASPADRGARKSRATTTSCATASAVAAASRREPRHDDPPGARARWAPGPRTKFVPLRYLHNSA